MSEIGSTTSMKSRMSKDEDSEEVSDDDVMSSEDEDETIARIQRAHFAQAAAMSARRRAPPRPRPMSHKRKMEAVKSFHDFTKKLKQDTGIRIRSLGDNILGLSDFSSEDSKSDSDGLSEEDFEVNPNAVKELQELTNDNESYIDPETGDIVEAKKIVITNKPSPTPIKETEEPAAEEPVAEEPVVKEPKTLSISDIINEGDLDLSKNVEIAEVEESELCPDKSPEELLDLKQEENSQDYDITEKLKEMGEISVKPLKKEGEDEEGKSTSEEKKLENDDEKKPVNPNALNVRRNIRDVMDEKNLDASTLTAQRQESERLARVQEQQRIIREVQRQIAINRQNKIHQKTLSLLQGGSSLLKKSVAHQKLNLPNTVLVKLPSGEVRKTLKQGQVEVSKVIKPTTSGAKPVKHEPKSEKKDVVEIVDSSSGSESSSSSSDSDDCIMLSDSEVPASPEAAEEDPHNSGLHVNDTYNTPDEQGRVLINIGHPENEEDIFLAPQIARIIKPHQIGGVRFLFDNIIESVERFSTSSGFGCILAHSMGLGKTLQIVCFCDIFLRHTTFKTVLCIMPINTLQNWVAEFNIWLPLDPTNSPLAAHGEVRPRNFPIYVLNDSHKTLQMRAKVVKDWTTSGGVLMIGYELYRLLSMKKDKKPRKKKKADTKAEEKDKEKEKEDKKNDKSDVINEDTQSSDITNQSKISEESKDKDEVDPSRTDVDGKEDGKKEEKKDDTPTDEEKKLLDEMYEALVRPGPDLVICDEGHRIKNSHSNISYALKQMRTKRRVVLTGYPLQNNLLEYWCMVDFVRPNYLGSKTEFCNMFERPIQNGQCIDSTPQDIRLMRYRAHVLHSLLVGFVQRRSHAVLQSTLPQKEEYVLLVRMTPLQRQLYDRFMNEVVRSTAVPNPLKAFAICCKIWNHPDVLYNFLKKRNEVSAAIEEDLDLEEIGGVTKAGRSRNSKAPSRRPAKPRGSSKKPAATIQPNTSTNQGPPRTDQPPYGNQSYPPNGPYGPPQQPYGPDQSGGSYPPYPNYQNQYYPPNQGYNQNYGNNYYPQQPPYNPNYPNQYPQNNSDPNQGYNQNYWGNGNYNYGNPNYYNNSQYPNNQPPQDFPRNPPTEYNNTQQYPAPYNPPANDQAYPGNSIQPYPPNPEYDNQPKPYQPPYQNPPNYPEFNANGPPEYPPQNNPPPENYPNQNYPPSFPNNAPYPNQPYNEFENRPPNYPGYAENPPQNQTETIPNQVQNPIKNEENVPTYTEIKPELSYGNPEYNYNQPNTSQYPNQDTNANNGYPCYPNFPPHLETKPPLDSAGSGSPVAWPLTETLKTEVDRLKAEEKAEVKSESDGEVKIADLDTKKIVKDDSKKENKQEAKSTPSKNNEKDNKKESQEKNTKKSKKEMAKSDESEPEVETTRKGKLKGKGKETKKGEPKAKPKPKSRAKGRKDRKSSKEKNKEKNNDESESEESEKEEKMNREEELAMVRKAEEMTYDWASELLKDYIPGIIENSAKLELFFYILNESIKLGDRLLLFSQSLFTLNLIEDFLERNYIPGTNCVWQRNTNYYRLDGSTHALEREKLINEFNANPNIYLFLVSTRAGSLGINLVGANRVIVFDASWNPCHDTQAVCRVYRYGQKKPCFVYRFVMDCCLEKKIYDRQINKQGMADRVVDECNPDAVLSMKEITNLCFDNDDQEIETKNLAEYKDKYIDVLMQGVITYHSKWLSKEPFQHESLLVDRKEKKLSSAEKRLAQRGYELEKKAALAPRPTPAYRTVRTADGSLVQRPVASVRPMQHAARWIPADVWRRQGMTAQEMTLPLDVVIPTNSAEKTNIVLKAGQRVMVLKSPKGIYMQLESGKIIAIKTSFKGLQKGAESKDSPIGKKIMGNRPMTTNIPGSLKNNAAITITSRSGHRPGMNRILNRPSLVGQNRIIRPVHPGQRITDIRNRLSFTGMRTKSPMSQGRIIRPNLPGSVSITKIVKETKKSDNDNNSDSNPAKMDAESDEAQVLDSEDEDKKAKEQKPNISRVNPDDSEDSKSSSSNKVDTETSNEAKSNNEAKSSNEGKSSNETKSSNEGKSVVLTTDEKLPSEEIFETKAIEQKNDLRTPQIETAELTPMAEQKKINLLKNYRHQRQSGRPPSESSLSQLEKTASVLNKEGMPDFRKNLDDITQSYSPGPDEKHVPKSKKKRPANKTEADSEKQTGMSHSVSSLLSPGGMKPRNDPPLQSTASVAPLSHNQGPSRMLSQPGMVHEMPNSSYSPSSGPLNMGHAGMMGQGPDLKVPIVPSVPPSSSTGPVLAHGYPASNAVPSEAPYGQYPGYGVGYGGYPTAPYYGGYGGAPYAPYPPYSSPAPRYPLPSPAAAPSTAPASAPAPAPAPDYMPPPQW